MNLAMKKLKHQQKKRDQADEQKSEDEFSNKEARTPAEEKRDQA